MSGSKRQRRQKPNAQQRPIPETVRNVLLLVTLVVSGMGLWMSMSRNKAESRLSTSVKRTELIAEIMECRKDIRDTIGKARQVHYRANDVSFYGGLFRDLSSPFLSELENKDMLKDAEFIASAGESIEKQVLTLIARLESSDAEAEAAIGQLTSLNEQDDAASIEDRKAGFTKLRASLITDKRYCERIDAQLAYLYMMQDKLGKGLQSQTQKAPLEKATK